MTLARRKLLFSLAASSVAIVPRVQAKPSELAHQHNPFSLGVASGSPTADGCVIWTRVMAHPDAALPDVPIELLWEVASDAAFTRVLQHGRTLALPDEAHSARVQLRGLMPRSQAPRRFFYRFMLGDAVSPVGRACSLPPAGSDAPLRLALASCQHYEHGYFAAHRDIAQQSLDLVVFVGDYIYEYASAPGRVRQHGGRHCVTLADYRERYSLYKSDADLQRAHASCSWVVTWDDHEVANDYANDRTADSRGSDFLARRAAAYQAYWEHQPLPRALKPVGPNMPIFRAYRWGNTAQLHMLDARQHRDYQACTPSDQGGSRTIFDDSCAQRKAGAQSLLGDTQERWLIEQISRSSTAFNLLGQASLMAPMRMPRDRRDPLSPADAYWNDSWDGYTQARTRLLQHFAAARNVVSLGGDVHAAYICDLKMDFDREQSPTIATEFVGTSITSPSWGQAMAERIKGYNPHMVYAKSDQRGYTLFDITAKQLQAQLRVLDNARIESPQVTTHARFVVDPKRAGALLA
jgi:alkaline phosphatase D